MTSDSSEWDEDLPADPEEEYQTFLRTLEWTEGFRLLFVQCTPAGGKQLIARVKEDIPQKTIEVLRLEQPIYNLYEIIERLPNREKINILFIQGLEHSLYEYEIIRFRDPSERDFYSWEGVPQILNHLNQQRERFRDDFNICFIFLLRSFSIKYFIHRAQDFFDWRSSLFTFPTNPELLEQESSRILREGNYDKYLSLTPEEQIQKILDIQELLEEDHQTTSYRASLLLELAELLSSAKEYEAAITAYDHALNLEPDKPEAWFSRGIVLDKLGHTEKAIASFDKALELKPHNDTAWNNRGIALKKLGRFEEALANYDKALEFKPDKSEAWNNRGIVLDELKRFQEAIASFDKALEFKPHNDTAWYNRGNTLKQLGRLEEAIASYDKALEFNPNDNEAWYNRGNALAELGHAEKAIASYDKALEFKPNKDEAWYNRGISLDELERFEEAIASYDKALEFNPDDDEAWYNKARCYALLGNVEQTIENLKQAIALNPKESREMATTEPDFDSIRADEGFQGLIQ